MQPDNLFHQTVHDDPNLAQENTDNREMHEEDSGFAYFAYFAVPSVFHWLVF